MDNKNLYLLAARTALERYNKGQLSVVDVHNHLMKMGFELEGRPFSEFHDHQETWFIQWAWVHFEYGRVCLPDEPVDSRAIALNLSNFYTI